MLNKAKKSGLKDGKKTGYDIGRIPMIYNDNALPVFHAPRGNNKLGSIPAWNLTPIMTCSGDACKTCGQDGCYAVKNMFAHGYNYSSNNVMRAWMDNTRLCKENLDQFEKQMDAYLSIMELSVVSVKLFRIHSAGDFFNVNYLDVWARLAAKHTGIKFLAFTKQFDVIRNYDSTHIPLYNQDNFSLVLSAWCGQDAPGDLKQHYPVAYCIADGDNVPDNCIMCPGNCEQCGMCWNLREIGKNTAFNKH